MLYITNKMLTIYNISVILVLGDIMVKRKKLFNTKLKVFRVEKGLTQEDLAIDLGINRGTVIEIERGTFNPSLKLAFSIAKYFDKGIQDIFEILEDEQL